MHIKRKLKHALKAIMKHLKKIFTYKHTDLHKRQTKIQTYTYIHMAYYTTFTNLSITYGHLHGVLISTCVRPKGCSVSCQKS